MIFDDDEVNTETYSLTVGRCPKTGVVSWVHIRTDDMIDNNHSPVDLLPSFLAFDDQGRLEKAEWHNNGFLHRDAGPARLWINSENGVVTNEEYRKFGEPHRDPVDGPACVSRQPDTGEVSSKLYFVEGKAIEEHSVYERDEPEGPGL